MAIDYIVQFTDGSKCTVAKVAKVQVSTDMPISGDALGEKWVFFYSVDPVATQDQVIFNGALRLIKSFYKNGL